MAFQCFVDAFNIGTGAAASTVVRTGYGFQPKACLYWWGGLTTGGPTFGRIPPKPGFGMAVSSTQCACVTAFSFDAQGTMSTNRYHTNANVIAAMLTSTLDQTSGLANLQTFDAGGQTLVINESFASNNHRIHCLALGGSDLTDAAVVQFQAPASTGAQTQDITSVGFQPDVVILMSTGLTTAPPAISATNVEFDLGVATGSGAQGCVALYDSDAQPSSVTGRYGYGGEVWAGFAGFTAPSFRATFDSFLSNGFRLSWLEKTSAVAWYSWALCLKGGSYLVGNLTTSTTLNATMVELGFGFAPTGCLLFSHSDAQSAQDTAALQANLSLGGFTSTSNRACQSTVSNNAANSAICASSLNEDACLRMLNNGTTSAGVVDVSAVGSDGFTLTMDVADVTTAKYVTYLAVGDTPPAAGARTPPTIITLGESTYGTTTATTRVTNSFNVQAGDVVVAAVFCDLASAIGTLTASGGTLAWTTRQDVGTSTQARMFLATAVVDVNKSMTVTATRSLSTSTPWSVAALVVRGVSGLGIDMGQAVSVTGSPSFALTTRASDSMLVLASVDQNALISAPTWLTNAGAFSDFGLAGSSGSMTYLGDHPDTGTPGTYAVGQSAPSGQLWAMAALELYGPLAAAAATSPPPSRVVTTTAVHRAAAA